MRVLLVALAVIWLVYLVQLIRNVRRLRRGRRLGPGGNAWLATLIVATLPYLLAAHHATSDVPAPVSAIRRRGARSFVAGSRHGRQRPAPRAHGAAPT